MNDHLILATFSLTLVAIVLLFAAARSLSDSADRDRAAVARIRADLARLTSAPGSDESATRDVPVMVYELADGTAWQVVGTEAGTVPFRLFRRVGDGPWEEVLREERR